jgi:hypothetical protein
VVKDASSDSDHRPALADGLGRESDDERARSPVGNLTQELAQLLAASIAQNQASSDRAGAPTNAELTSLADLVSAAAASSCASSCVRLPAGDRARSSSDSRPRVSASGGR